MLKTCFSCGISVARKDCHKNRYKEYVCRSCQSVGVKLTGRQRFRRLKRIMQRIEPTFWRIVIWVGLTASTLWVLLKMFESIGS